MNPSALIVLDGFGYNPDGENNAIAQAKTPFLDFCLQRYPHTVLECSGSAVGLLPEQAGNSQVGHLTIGAGRIIEQPVVQLHKSIEDGSFFNNPILINNLKQLAQRNKTLHVMGLLSDAGVHSHEYHLYAFLKAAIQIGVKQIIVHAFTDGRDTPPQSAAIYFKRLDDFMKKHSTVRLGTIMGRFYAMDRDNNWDRTQAAYDALTMPMEIQFDSWYDLLNYYYEQKITDEFIPPTQLKSNALMQSGDGIIFFNFRPDRARQLAAAFTQRNFDKFPLQKIDLVFFITAADYEDPALQITPLIKKQHINNTLKEILSAAGKTIFAIAETEKYAHVTYFFNGMKEEPVPGEERIMIPTIRAKNYIDHPCMSAPQITQAIITSLEQNPKDFYVINYANADMVGHSGNLAATIKAVECLDEQLQRLYDEIMVKRNGTLYITGDHGNAEQMQDLLTGQLKTAHTKNPVYFIMVRKDLENQKIALPLKSLKNVARFILNQMKIAIPDEMTS